MANEAYVAGKIAEASKSEKALLLGAIGAMSSTPTNSANVAGKELGLSKEEIQEARWVALFRKGKTDLEFLKGLWEIINKKEEEMPTDKVAKVLEEVKDFSLKERKELVKGIQVLGKKKEKLTLNPKEKVIQLLEEALGRTKAGELKWRISPRRPQPECCGPAYPGNWAVGDLLCSYEVNLDSITLALQEVVSKIDVDMVSFDGYAAAIKRIVKISLQTGESMVVDADGWFNKIAGLHKKIIDLIDCQEEEQREAAKEEAGAAVYKKQRTEEEKVLEAIK